MQLSDKCKIIFPSTHVVYEGIEEVKTDIKEDEKQNQFYLILLLKLLMKSN